MISKIALEKNKLLAHSVHITYIAADHMHIHYVGVHVSRQTQASKADTQSHKLLSEEQELLGEQRNESIGMMNLLHQLKYKYISNISRTRRVRDMFTVLGLPLNLIPNHCETTCKQPYYQ